MEQLTVREVLEITINNLKGIQIPVELCDTVGQAIVGSIRNLTACVNAMDAQNADGGENDGSDADPE
jgi:hypothetical protein